MSQSPVARGDIVTQIAPVYFDSTLAQLDDDATHLLAGYATEDAAGPADAFPIQVNGLGTTGIVDAGFKLVYADTV